MGYLRRVLCVTLRDKEDRSKPVKPRMSSHLSDWRDPSNVSPAMCPERPRKEWRTKYIRLLSPPTGKRSKVCPRTRWRDYISDLAWFRLGLEPAELSEIAVHCEVYRVLLGRVGPTRCGAQCKTWARGPSEQ